MSGADAVEIRTLAFGDLETDLWATAWIGSVSFIAFGSAVPGASASTVRVTASGASAASDEWRLTGDGVDVTVSPASAAVTFAEVEGYDQLCWARGRLALDGTEWSVDAPGRRAVRAGVDFGRLDSLRDLCAWFPPDDAVALTALRPRGAKGHAGDVIVASVFESNGAAAVADPRLSTTYAADGSPARAGLELWLGVDDAEEQFPRRAAGEALGPHATATADGISITAYPFRWHSRGADGAGVYLLARVT
ncbi:MAG TPA: hypothetical protein VMU39_07905 [Solirubrobacteraceae bacterium]|nr:hypothetical protein [Solirubrobacteraceae bacterium]